MTTQSQTKIYFNIKELNSKIKNLLSNGFEEYLNTWEKTTVCGNINMNHIIFTCTKGNYSGSVCDIYYNEKTNICWIEYSRQ